MVVLHFYLNEESMGELFMLRQSDGDIWIKKDDLKKTRLREGLGRETLFEGEKYMPLSTIPGLSFKINEKEASLVTVAPPDLFVKQDLNISYRKPYEVEYTRDNSAFLNYGLILSNEEPKTSLSAEAGFRSGNYLAVSTFNYTGGKDSNKFVRLLSSITRDDRDTLRTIIFGDHTAVSGAFGSNIIVGGLNISKNYAIDPYFIKFPSLALGGVLNTPSDLDIYVNGMRVRKERLQPGPFLLKDVPAVVGLGQANIVIKDAFGTERVIAQPFYYSDRLLTKGLHEYSYSIGFSREDLGEKSFSYRTPVILAFHNYGFSDHLKAGYSFEASDSLINLGPTASFLIPNAGIVEAAFALSNSDGKTGAGAFLEYSFRSSRLSARVAMRYLTREFSSLSTGPEDRKPSFEYSASVGWMTQSFGSVSIEYTKSSFHFGDSASRSSITYSKPFAKNVTFFASASRENDRDETRDELFFGLHIYFGKGVSGSLNYTDSDGQNLVRANIQKSLPVGTGFGFNLDVEKDDGRTNTFGEVRYQHNYGQYGISYRDLQDSREYSFTASGGIGYIGKSVFLSRPIFDSFAKVSVGGLKDVRVYHFGNEVGRTDRNGEFIIPLMSSYIDNKIDIEHRDIPVDYRIQKTTKYISPPLRGGALVRFNITRITGISGNLSIIEDGKKVVPGSGVINVVAGEQTISGLIGRNGEFYIENVPPGRHAAKALYDSNECEFAIIIPDSKELWIQLGEILCEGRK